jgi:selenocysteine lyase/cysteine desulfurase
MASFYGPGMRLSSTASRFDLSLAWHSAIAERASARVLDELGRERIHDHDAALARRLTDGLRDAGVPFLDHGEAHMSPIVSVAPASPDASARMAEAGVVAAVRGGRVRVAVHVYVTAAQVDALVELLARP